MSLKLSLRAPTIGPSEPAPASDWIEEGLGGLLPSAPADGDGLRGAARLVQAGQIGGDLYDFVRCANGSWLVLVADVSGKGVPAALVLTSTPRTPEAAAVDLARIITHYGAAWRTDHVIVVGYSFGADVLPFLVNRLEPAARAKVARVVVPEVERLTVPVTCVQGADEEDSACGQIRNPRVRVVTVGAGHRASSAPKLPGGGSIDA